MAGNPAKAVEAILDDDRDVGGGLTVHPLSIARYALLERIGSPILFKKADDSVDGIVATLYVMCADVEDLVGRNNSEIRRDALVWADEISPDRIKDISEEIVRQIQTATFVSPDGKDDSCKKKAPTDG